MCFNFNYFLFISLCGLQDITCSLIYYHDPLLSAKYYKKKIQVKLGVFIYDLKCKLLKVTCVPHSPHWLETFIDLGS
jgi:hypothetical protein